MGQGGAGVGQGWVGWEGSSAPNEVYQWSTVCPYGCGVVPCSFNTAVVCSVQCPHWPSCMELRGTSLPLQGNSRHYHTCCTVQLLLHCCSYCVSCM